MKGQYTKKRRERCVLLLDDAFDSPAFPPLLLAGGYARVERFTTHFPRPDDQDKREQNVKDPRVIRLSHSKKWLIVTTDSDMWRTHVEEIKKHPETTILATAHNKAPDPFEWIEALIKGRSAIERRFKKQAAPWFAQLDRSGKITTCRTITEEHFTRRKGPREQKDVTAGM